MIDQGVTRDAFLGGRVEALQPARGHHRSGLEAVLLGAALDSAAKGALVDLGAGAGVAGFCAAARCPGLAVALAEREPELVELARQSLDLPPNHAIAERVAPRVFDITTPEAVREASGFARESADFVLCNPPFYQRSSASVSPAIGRGRAHMLEGGFEDWLRCAAWLIRPGGTLVLIVAAAALTEIFDGLAGRFGAVSLLPIHSRPGLAAGRLLLRGVKGRATPPAILPGLVLHGETGSAFTAGLEQVLRNGAGLAEIHPSWQGAQ